jgi:myo-inositol-1(or 4)-monophosphatase
MGRQAKELSAAREAARAAGRLLRANLAGRGEVSFKGAVDLVTVFDRQAQELVDGRLSAAFPEHGFLSEEDLDRPGTSGCRWVLDPLDGTTNFAHTLPIFSVSLALERQGDILLGVVYDPMRDEMFWAAEGDGAFLNGRPVRVSPVARLDRSLLATGFPYDIRESRLNNLDHFTNFALRAQAVRRCGSAALDLSYVACGRFDGFWELKLKPWDVAAGSLLIREAGGRVTDFDAGESDLFQPELAASNGLIHEEMLRVLSQGRTRRSEGASGR